MSARFVSETIAHWEDVYRARSAEALSWYQAEPVVSLELIEGLGIGPAQPVLDVGGGTSLLAARLLHRGFGDVTVLDLSASALAKTRAALGCFADRAALLEQDVLEWSPPRRYALWHDRAVFHFLVDARDRRRYLACLREALAPGGGVVVGTFAPDGPDRCSGLPVAATPPPSWRRPWGRGSPSSHLAGRSIEPRAGRSSPSPGWPSGPDEGQRFSSRPRGGPFGYEAGFLPASVR